MDHARSSIPAGWKLPPILLPEFRSVEVWAADLASISESLESCADLLDPAERAHANTFRFKVHRERFIRRRWLRRRILVDRFGVDPREVRFETSVLGRVSLIGPHSLLGVGLSTSHTDGRALVAIRSDGELGVDIARLSDAMTRGEASVFMSPRELAHWSALPEEAFLASFYRLWTRKEACLKAAGTGLARDPRTLEAWESPVVGAPDRQWPAGAWYAVDLDLGLGWAGAVAVPQ